MATSSARRRSGSRHHTVEQEALSEIASEAEVRMAAKRAARAEAREIRMREIERQQLEDQERERLKSSKEAKKGSSYVSSYATRRGGNDTLDDLKKELSDLNDKYIRTMTHNAQLDNDKQTLIFRVSLLTEDIDDLKEENTELKRQLKDKTRDFEHKKKAHELLQAANAKLQEQLNERDALIEECGLVFVSDDISDGEEDDEEGEKTRKKKCALVSQRALEVLESFSGTLDGRLIKMDEEKKALEKLVKKLKHDLDEERERRSTSDKYASHSPTPNRFSNGGGGGAGGDAETESGTHSELKRQLKDYKARVGKAHQEVATLEGMVARLEAQAKRYKAAAANSERSEEELRAEKRKLQKELREVENSRAELEVERNHLLKRLERSKGSKVK